MTAYPHPPSQLLRYYSALEYASEEMLQAARVGDWDAVCRLEGACGVVIAKLRRLAQQAPLPQHEQPERVRILRTILACDAEIRRIAQPQPAVLERPGVLFEVPMASMALH